MYIEVRICNRELLIDGWMLVRFASTSSADLPLLAEFSQHTSGCYEMFVFATLCAGDELVYSVTTSQQLDEMKAGGVSPDALRGS